MSLDETDLFFKFAFQHQFILSKLNNIFDFYQMKTESKSPFAHLSLNKPQQTQAITIFPREVIFQDIMNNSCYEIELYVRNNSSEIQKIRLIGPKTRHFKIKTQEGLTKKLAQGLALKIFVLFYSERIGEQRNFEDKLIVCGDSFQQEVNLKAYVPREILSIPKELNAGRLMIGSQNLRQIPVANSGKRAATLQLECDHNCVTIVTKQATIKPGETKQFQFKIKSKKSMSLRDRLKFSNGFECQLLGFFVEEGVEIFGAEGDKLMMLDVGQIFIGEKVSEKLYLLNNSEKKVQAIFKTFSKNIELSEIKVDQKRANFIVKSLPSEYAKELKQGFSSIQVQRATIDPFSEFENILTIQKMPTANEMKRFHCYAMGLLEEEIMEEPIIETLIINSFNCKHAFKIPIKFISVYPRLKINTNLLEFGEVKERTDTVKEIIFQNQGERDIRFTVLYPTNVKVQELSVVPGHRSLSVKVTLRACKAGRISQAIQFKFFDGLMLQVKVFANCRNSSIRSKKMCNLNSTRDFKQEFKLYQTLQTCRHQANLLSSTQIMNRTDALGDIRVARRKKIEREYITCESQPRLLAPKLDLNDEASEFKVLLPLRNFAAKTDKKDTLSRLSIKQLSKYTRPLKIEELQKIRLKQTEIAFGTIFIDNEMTKQVKITNSNIDAILFEWDIGKNETLKGTSSETVKIEGRSEKEFIVKFKPNSLGAMSVPLNYVINRSHIFQIYITAYVTLINLDISTKSIDLGFAPYDTSFQKSQQIELSNKGTTPIKCFLKLQEAKHFKVCKDSLDLEPATKQTVTITYHPIENQDILQERVDYDRFIVKVVGGAENIIKCTGTVSDSKIVLKESEIICLNHLVSVPFYGKLNIKSCTKAESLYKIDIPNDLAQIISFDKQSSILCGEQKKEINYTILCHSVKRISSCLTFTLRGGKSIKLPVECNFVMPEIIANQDVIDFGNIPIMGSNYQQVIRITNNHRSQVKLELSKKADCQNYLIEIRVVPRTISQEEVLLLAQPKLKKKTTLLREDLSNKRGTQGPKIIKLQPNAQVKLQIKFIPRKQQQFQIQLPLKLHGTGDYEIYPIKTKLRCTSIEPVVYLHPQKIAFETRIIGEGKNNLIKCFQIRNPHDHNIEWRIQNRQGEKNNCFYLNTYCGVLKAHEQKQIQVSFKPENQGLFNQKLEVVLKDKKVSHISLELEGQAIFPSLKFSCNEVIMPVVPMRVEARTFITLQNHGYDAITISKWKTTNSFTMVDITANFVQGRLLSLAKKSLKVEIICCSQFPISFTTMLQFYDQFGTKYELPLSCTFDSCLMTTYNFLESESNRIVFDRKENSVKMPPCQYVASENQSISDRDLSGSEFVKNWLNYQINLGVKKFPHCLIDSQGELFYRMITRMAGCELVRRFQSANTEPTTLYNYYSQCIRVLKMQGAFLNQIRPQYLLSFKDYSAYLTGKNMMVQSQSSFQFISLNAWTALFYQLCKLYILSQLTQKMISKFCPHSQAISSSVYSSQQLLLFRFLNSFMNDDPAYNFNDKVRIFQIIQRSLQQTLGIKLTNSLVSLKISIVVMTPELFLNMISKFLFETLKQYGLSMYLTQCDLEVLGPKEIALYLISFIGMLYHYATLTPICFEASIGDKITKIIEIENPVNRKAKYRVKLQGSEQFSLQQEQISLGPKCRDEIRVSYQCKQNKQEEAKLFLIPIKEDINNANIQPLGFKLKTSIISKITLKKIQISAFLYEVTNVTLEAELPIDITELAEFSVSILDADQNCPSFYCFQQLNRTLKNSHDRLDIKLVPLTLGYKYCRVCYRSATFGEFNFEIMAKIDPSPLCKEIRLKQLKVNKQQIVQITLPKENQELQAALKYLSDHHYKIPEQPLQTKRTISGSKYIFGIVESSYISICDESIELTKTQLQEKENIQLDLRCIFGKAFGEYSCTLMVRNETARDIRMYKLITSVAMKPKLIDLQVRCKARESTQVNIPIKNVPCQLSIQHPVQQFTLSNFAQYIKQPTELIGTFSPEWMMHRQLSLVCENRQTLEQVIYNIKLKGEEPAFFDYLTVTGSSVFSKRVKIHINLNMTEEHRVECNSKRISLQDNPKVGPYKKWLWATIIPGQQQETTSIQLFKAKSSQFYWASLTVLNEKIENYKTITLQQMPNGRKCFILEELHLSNDHQISCTQTSFFSYSVINNRGCNSLCLDFHPLKQMRETQKIYLTNNQKQYEISVKFIANSLPIVSLPEIVSYNMATKTSTVNVLNNSDTKGIYHAKIQPQGIFSIDHSEFELKAKEKRQLKILFTPRYLQNRCKGVIKFESQTLPTYIYHFSAISEFKQLQKTLECEYYSDKTIFKDILFINWLEGTEKYQVQTSFKGTPFEVVEPAEKSFSLQPGASKRIIIKVSQSSKKQHQNGLVTIRLNEKKWKYTLIPLQIKDFNKKIIWNCQARQTYYENVELPQGIKVKSIQSCQQIDPYLSFTTQENSNNIKLKYTPLKPLSKDQFQILLITDSSKFVIHCTISVQMPPFDDTIHIKTKEINEIGCISFKLTNIKKISVPFKAYFLKGLPDLSVQVERQILESYGRIGTTIFVKFTSNVFNKRVEDELWVQTSEMLWRFKVVGLLSKKHFLKQ